MRTILVGDLHLKARLILPIVTQKVEELNCERIILLGDYTDDWNCNLDEQLYLDELEFLIEWKKKMQNQGKEVVTLLGNHDAPYLTGELRNYSLHRGYYKVSKKLLDLGVQIAFKLDNFLVSHAGYCGDFSIQDWHLRELNQSDLDARRIDDFEKYIGQGRGGWYKWGSPLWADYNYELLKYANPEYKFQIVGHTPQKEISIENLQDTDYQLIDIDSFNLRTKSIYPYYEFIGNGDLLLYDDGKLEVISTDWKKKESLEKLGVQRGILK